MGGNETEIDYNYNKEGDDDDNDNQKETKSTIYIKSLYARNENAVNAAFLDHFSLDIDDFSVEFVGNTRWKRSITKKSNNPLSPKGKIMQMTSLISSKSKNQNIVKNDYVLMEN